MRWQNVCTFLLSWIWLSFHSFIFYYFVRFPCAQCIWTDLSFPPMCLMQHRYVSKENLLWLPNQSVCHGHNAIFVFLPSLLFTCTHAPWLLLLITRSVVSGCFQNFEFLDQQKRYWILSQRKGGMSCLLGTWGHLPFHFLYFPSLAVLSDPVKLETEGQMAIKWSQKDEQSTRLLSIYLKHLCSSGHCPKPLEHIPFQTK